MKNSSISKERSLLHLRISVLGADVAVEGYLGGIPPRAVIVGAVDGLFEFFLGPLPVADLLQL